MEIDKIHKIYAEQIQWRVFRNRRSVYGSDHTDAKGLGTLKSMEIEIK